MKLIIAGSRTIDKYRAFYEALKYISRNDVWAEDLHEFVTGCCPQGADQVPFLWVDGDSELKKAFKITEFPAEWKTYGRRAGMVRNKQMAEYADELLLIWDGKSGGSANMKAEMIKLGKPVHEIIVKRTIQFGPDDI